MPFINSSLISLNLLVAQDPKPAPDPKNRPRTPKTGPGPPKPGPPKKVKKTRFWGKIPMEVSNEIWRFWKNAKNQGFTGVFRFLAFFRVFWRFFTFFHVFCRIDNFEPKSPKISSSLWILHNMYNSMTICTHTRTLQQLCPQTSTNPGPQTDPQIQDLSETLFRNPCLHTQAQALDLRDPQRGISVHTQTQRPVSGV